MSRELEQAMARLYNFAGGLCGGHYEPKNAREAELGGEALEIYNTIIAALTASPQAAPEDDDFNGDNAHLVACIDALLRMDADGALVPHGIGGHARKLLNAAARRLASPQVQGGEAVAWQYRTPRLLSDGWHPWQQCDRELFDELTEHGSYAGRPVQVRALCATPQRAAKVIAWTDGNTAWLTVYGKSLGPGTRALVDADALAAPVSAVGVDDCAKCGKSNRLNCNDECWNCGAALICRCHTDDQRRYCADREKCSRAYALSAAAQDQGEGNGA